jgi:hypothetical protein
VYLLQNTFILETISHLGCRIEEVGGLEHHRGWSVLLEANEGITRLEVRTSKRVIKVIDV